MDIGGPHRRGAAAHCGWPLPLCSLLSTAGVVVAWWIWNVVPGTDDERLRGREHHAGFGGCRRAGCGAVRGR